MHGLITQSKTHLTYRIQKCLKNFLNFRKFPGRPHSLRHAPSSPPPYALPRAGPNFAVDPPGTLPQWTVDDINLKLRQRFKHFAIGKVPQCIRHSKVIRPDYRLRGADYQGNSVVPGRWYLISPPWLYFETLAVTPILLLSNQARRYSLLKFYTCLERCVAWMEPNGKDLT